MDQENRAPRLHLVYHLFQAFQENRAGPLPCWTIYACWTRHPIYASGSCRSLRTAPDRSDLLLDRGGLVHRLHHLIRAGLSDLGRLERRLHHLIRADRAGHLRLVLHHCLVCLVVRLLRAGRSDLGCLGRRLSHLIRAGLEDLLLDRPDRLDLLDRSDPLLDRSDLPHLSDLVDLVNLSDLVDLANLPHLSDLVDLANLPHP